MIPFLNFIGNDSNETENSENDTQTELSNFINNFSTLVQNIQQNIPMEFIDFVLSSFDNLEDDIVEIFISDIQKATLAVSSTYEIISNSNKLLNPIEIFTSYFDHLDKNKDGKLSVDEIIDIGNVLQKRHMEKKDILKNITKDSQELISLVQSMSLKENVLEFANSMEFEKFSILVSKIFSTIAKFDGMKFYHFTKTLNEIIQFFSDYKTTLNQLLKPENNGFMSFLSCMVGENSFLMQSIFLFQELNSMIDFDKITVILKDIVNIFLDEKLFKSITLITSVDDGIKFLKILFNECQELYEKILSVFSIAVDRSLSILDINLDDVKKACMDALDKDGDGKIELSDIKTILDQDGDGDVDLKDIVKGVRSLFKKKAKFK